MNDYIHKPSQLIIKARNRKEALDNINKERIELAQRLATYNEIETLNRVQFLEKRNIDRRKK